MRSLCTRLLRSLAAICLVLPQSRQVSTIPKLTSSHTSEGQHHLRASSTGYRSNLKDTGIHRQHRECPLVLFNSRAQFWYHPCLMPLLLQDSFLTSYTPKVMSQEPSSFHPLLLRFQTPPRWFSLLLLVDLQVVDPLVVDPLVVDPQVTVVTLAAVVAAAILAAAALVAAAILAAAVVAAAILTAVAAAILTAAAAVAVALLTDPQAVVADPLTVVADPPVVLLDLLDLLDLPTAAALHLHLLLALDPTVTGLNLT